MDDEIFKLEQRAVDAYEQRNMLAIMMARMALALGWTAGWGRDDSKPDWDEEWRTVVYIDLPQGNGVQQISYHVGPLFGGMARKVLPQYAGKWDNDFASRRPASTLMKFFNGIEGQYINLALLEHERKIAERTGGQGSATVMSGAQYVSTLSPDVTMLGRFDAVDCTAKLIGELVAIARAADALADGTEDRVSENILVVDRNNFESLCSALVVLDDLPEIAENIIGTGPAKAEHELRHIVDDLRTARGLINDTYLSFEAADPKERIRRHHTIYIMASSIFTADEIKEMTENVDALRAAMDIEDYQITLKESADMDAVYNRDRYAFLKQRRDQVLAAHDAEMSLTEWLARLPSDKATFLEPLASGDTGEATAVAVDLGDQVTSLEASGVFEQLAPALPKISFDDVLTKLSEVKEMFGVDAARLIRDEHGKSNRIANIDPANYQAVLDACAVRLNQPAGEPPAKPLPGTDFEDLGRDYPNESEHDEDKQ